MYLSAISTGCSVPRTQFDGSVHSVFRHACNVRLENGSLVTFLVSGLSDVPQGIRLNTPPGFAFDVCHLQPNQIVACRGGVVRFTGSDLMIDLRRAHPWSADLSKLRLDMDLPQTQQAWQVAWQELRSYHSTLGFERLGAPLSSKVGASIRRLVEATRCLDAANACAAAGSLIGLGAGLTPSGDDFLVGYLAGLWATASDETSRREFVSTFGRGIVRLAQHTTDISRAYLEHAAQARVSGLIVTLLTEIGKGARSRIVQAATRAALSVGYTSGADGVVGVLIGLNVWQKSVDFLAIG